ncbi:MFS transporter [filamentous cyanobacterium LEGE 11480]|uniref:MFS transporter n=2 Tax=Romeriopsis TaxID=2992131 RepID=A0A928VT52_9CYAN|nr:MFS transporter [Romeriopsis navalis LEGE 11480]
MQLWNMNLGFLGIQFGWGLQMVNMSAIFEQLGAKAHQIPILWLAAPLTGLVIQPLVGHLSDRTWTFLGRRRPYFLVGAILSAIALVALPRCTSLWVAAAWLCLLDGSANVSMVPFRAFVGDLLPEQQRTQGFALQSVMVGLGAIAAASLPWLLSHVFGVDNFTSAVRRIPQTVELSFYIGAALFLGLVLWTVVTTPEQPPPAVLESAVATEVEIVEVEAPEQTVWQVLWDLPTVMQQLAWVQGFTWLGIFCFLLYFPPAVARNIFGAIDQTSPLYNAGIEWAGLCFALSNVVCVGVSFLLPTLARRLGSKPVHGVCLLIGGLSLVPMLVIHNQYWLLGPMVGFGILRASTLSLPYALLEKIIPDNQRGMYQGIFNFFVVLPEIAISLGFGWIMQHWMHDNRVMAVAAGGGCLLVAAVLMLFVRADATPTDADEPVVPVVIS